MFDYIRKLSHQPLTSIGNCALKVFKKLPDGSLALSTDYSLEPARYEDFLLDNMISANVPIGDSPSFEDISLNALDSVEKNTEKLLDSNLLIEK